MLRFLHSLAATLFYLLGSAFAAAYLLYHNDIAAAPAGVFLYLAQLPLLICGLLYGGLSVYRSIEGEVPSKMLSFVVGIPLLVFLTIVLILRFLPV